MNYEKPAVAEVASAMEAVQSSMQKMHVPVDLPGLVTVSAYQSDEQ